MFQDLLRRKGPSFLKKPEIDSLALPRHLPLLAPASSAFQAYFVRLSRPFPRIGIPDGLAPAELHSQATPCLQALGVRSAHPERVFLTENLSAPF